MGPIELDGRTLEGGAQLIRIALCLSALTGKAVQIDNIRGNRSGGRGLKAQHLACVKWLSHACNAHVEGAEKGSKTLLFRPDAERTGLSPAFKKNSIYGRSIYQCELDIGTAGSTGQALQAILPFILFTKLPTQDPIQLTVSGGTNVSGSPSFEYIKYVLLPTLQSIGFPPMTIELQKRGRSHGGSSIGSYILEIQPREEMVLPAFSFGLPDTAGSLQPFSHLRAIFLGPTHCHDEFKAYFSWRLKSQKSPWPDDPATEISCEDSQHEKRLYLILIPTIPTPPSPTPSSSTPSTSSTPYTLGADHLYFKKITNHSRAIREMVDRVTAELQSRWEGGTKVDENMRDQLVQL
ncbi:RNA 3'-terminal phosphate cyclase [Fulvia fulva]|uniref:RNA 3'-terminal phosphate cyclase n=1 Tax=Passalora fulva TaxID=5499 RepID=A0A9Q8P8Z3_PASFU|nr:RNA 3'-terminal phosphate cyclase [Fulvia fulva]KAK4625297.1 RNA 3'-terminal phosphate cyclase [Fulvia fulva]UJO17608.1 RNA 3'-terminal phosphate cyclase [Fulvia fulva]WPV15457.1 RNA 3'-terminal phosphate cyclase [Fulvia fulva]